mgnify:CR=1 FL=1
MRALIHRDSTARPASADWFAVLLALLVLLPTFAAAQESKPAETTEPETPPVQPISAAQIPGRAEDTTRIMRSIRERMSPSPDVERIRESLTGFVDRLEQMKADPTLENLAGLGLRGLDELDQSWSSAAKQARGWQTALSARSTALGEQLELLRSERAPWQLTYETRSEQTLPDALVARVQSVLAEIEAVRKLLNERLDDVLTLQNGISERLVLIEDINDSVDQAQAAFRDQMLVRLDGRPLWLFFTKDETLTEDDVQAHMEQSGRQSLINVKLYLENYPDRLIAVGLSFLFLSGLLVYVRSRRRARHAAGDTEDVIDVLSRPIAAALLVSVAVSIMLFKNAPPALLDLVRVIAALPVYLLMRRVLPEEIKLPIYALIVLFVLDMAGGLLARTPEIQRLIDLVIAGASLGVVMWFLAPGGWASANRGGFYWQMALRLVKAAALLLTLALVANIVGAISLAALLTDATLTSAYIGIGLYAVVLILQGVVDSFLHSRLAEKSRGLSQRPEFIKAGFERVINLLAAIVWAGGTLRAFRILEPVLAGLSALFLTPVTFGNFSISLSDIFAFVIALWAGLTISKILRFILENDVFPRVSMPRGVPSAISSMAHYAILTIAFFVALAVAGIELGKFAIIAGAVGVGIGFGLQNIVNNFLSGLILLFERPIQAGDSVEMGTLFGRVVRIGIRSSTVRTFQGAEVIVPNADLIAKEVINWTLTDAHRRLEIPVGVTYRAQPREVINILMAAARAHKETMREPDPFAIFVGYGSSSIDFELRCWISNYNDGLRIKTELLLDIWDRLEEAGIEIPFPQQDLHLRSVDGAAAATLAGRPTPAADPAPTAELLPVRPAASAGGNTRQSAAEPSADADAGGDGATT